MTSTMSILSIMLKAQGGHLENVRREDEKRRIGLEKVSITRNDLENIKHILNRLVERDGGMCCSESSMLRSMIHSIGKGE